MKSYAVYYNTDANAEAPINVFDSTYMVIRDGCYVFYQARSSDPQAAYSVNTFYVLEVAQ